MPDTAKQWSLYETRLRAAVYGNDFLYVTFEAELGQDHDSVKVRDLYHGEGKYHTDIFESWDMTIAHIVDAASSKFEVELSPA